MFDHEPGLLLTDRARDRIEPCGRSPGCAGTCLEGASLGKLASPPGRSSWIRVFLSRPWFVLPPLHQALGSRGHRSCTLPPHLPWEAQGKVVERQAPWWRRGCKNVDRGAGPRPSHLGRWPVTSGPLGPKRSQSGSPAVSLRAGAPSLLPRPQREVGSFPGPGGLGGPGASGVISLGPGAAEV